MDDRPDPLSEVVRNAVRDQLEIQLPQLADLICSRLPGGSALPAIKPADAPLADGARFVSVKEMSQRLGVNRSTLAKWERSGKVPKRLKFASGRKGWTAAQVEAWFRHATPAEASGDNRIDRVRQH